MQSHLNRLGESNPRRTHYEERATPLWACYLHRRQHLRPEMLSAHSALRLPGHDPGHGPACLPVTGCYWHREARSRKTAYFGGVSVAGLRAIDLKAAAYGSGNRLEVAFIGTHH